MRRLPVALLLLLFFSVAVVSRASAQTSVTAPAARPVLVIQSTPGGVQVYVDDELLGTTSPEGRLKISTLKPGKHTLRLSLSGYQDWDSPITLAAGPAVTKAIKLTEQNTAANPQQGVQPRSATAPSLPQQAGPSYQQTRDWVVSEISQFAGGFYYPEGADAMGGRLISSVYQDVSMDNCELKYEVRGTGPRYPYQGQQGQDSFDETVTIPLSKVTTVQKSDGCCGYANVGGVEIFASTAAITTVMHISSTAGGTSDKQKNTNVGKLFIDGARTDYVNLADRMQKALSHAVDICRAQAPKTGETF